jgi:hypothetical protein
MGFTIYDLRLTRKQTRLDTNEAASFGKGFTMMLPEPQGDHPR